MRFGPVPVAEAEGAVLAHSLRIGRGRLRKGHRLTAADLPALGAAGYTEIVVGTLETGDISEDDPERAAGIESPGIGCFSGPDKVDAVH